MKKHLSLLKVLMVLLALLFITQGYAQQLRVSGKVSDATDGQPLPGVTVLVKGTTTGTSTDFGGNYSINVNSGATLVFSFIGYNSQEFVIAATRTLNVVLQPSVTTLEEAVVIGYGTVKKSDATGSVSVVGTKDFNRGAITSAQELLVGKSTGVVITTSSGAPGAGATIRIRGGSSLNASNDPLIVIDGVPVDNTGVSGLANSLSVINPNDIESFTVLKDASATAIYGSRASNGVIIITTKKGTSQALKKKISVTYNGNFSLNTVPKKLEVLTGSEYKALVTDLKTKGFSGLSDKALKRLGTAETDWQDEIFRSAVTHDNNLSFNGVVANLPYRASLGYTGQDGTLKNTNMKRTTLALALNPSLFDNHLKVDLNIKGTNSKHTFGDEGAVGAAVAYDPTQSVMNGNTRFGGYYTWVNLADTLPNGKMDPNGYPNPIGVSNPVGLINQIDNQSDVLRSIGNLQLDYKFPFLPELRTKLNLGYDYSSSEGFNNAPDQAAWTYRSGIGRKTDYTQKKNMELLDFYFDYTKDLAFLDSRLNAVAGYSWQHFKREGSNFARNGAGTIVQDSSKYINENFLVSFFGRVNYNILDRYLLTFTLRNDGSSRFAEENRWGLFPSAALAWKINNESFFKGFKNLNDLKLRLGYGETGQQDIGDNYYPYLPIYQISNASASYQFGDSYYLTLRPNAYDANLRWESTTTYNVGLDFAFLNSRIEGAIDWYLRKTEDLISTVPIPVGTNFSNYLTTNVGTLENTGVEVMLNTKPVITNDLVWTFGVNVSYNQNQITKLLLTDDPKFTGVATGGISGGVGNFIQNHSVGFPANSFYVFQQVYDKNGFPIEGLYVDRSGLGGNVAGNELNKFRYKKPAPDAVLGISTALRFKNFDALLSARANIGNYMYNNVASDRANYQAIYNQSGFFNNLPVSINNTKFKAPQYWSDYYIENASFLRLDNISVGYNFQNLTSQKLEGRVGFTVQNAFVLTKYSGLDPEVSSGIDRNMYPRARNFVLGLNVNF